MDGSDPLRGAVLLDRVAATLAGVGLVLVANIAAGIAARRETG